MDNDELKGYIERAERLAAEKADIAEMEKDLKADVKARGYNIQAFNTVLARRKKDRDEVDALDADIELYESNLAGV